MLVAQLLFGALLLWQAATGFDLVLPDAADDGDRPAAVAPAPTARAAARVDRFDAPAAMRLAARQVRLGPRPSLSPANRRSAALLRPLLPRGRFLEVPGGLRNVEGSLPGRGRPLLLIAHYDTTPVPGYLGANNAAAAVGAVVEIARSLRRDHDRRRHRAIRFLLTDGEEPARWPPEDFLREGVRGSRHDAATQPLPHRVVVMDFVAQKGLQHRREGNSDERLWAQLRAASRRVGQERFFPDGTQGAVEDDHVPYLERGVRAIDLIDFDYPCWQRRCDTLDKLSTASLDASGETVLELLRTLRRG